VNQVRTVAQVIPSLQSASLIQKMSDTLLDLKAYLDTRGEKAVEASSETISTDERYILPR